MDPASIHEGLLRDRINKSRTDIDNSHEALKEVAYRGRLPEEHFRQYFVPYFTGKVQPDATNNVVNTWISIAGSPTSEVDIIDAEGNVLFAAPPLYDTSVLNVEDKTGPGLLQILREHNRISADIPDAAAARLKVDLERKLKTMFMPADSAVSANAKRWREIGDRYGVPSPDDKSGQSAASKPEEGYNYSDFS